MRYDTGGPFIVWLDFGFDGWSPRSFDTLEEATKLALSDKHDESFVITKVVSEERFVCICTKAKLPFYCPVHGRVENEIWCEAMRQWELEAMRQWELRNGERS